MEKDTRNEIKHTAHSSYRCRYHIVFAPKYRRKEIYGQLRKDIGEILRKLCEQKKVEIIEAEDLFGVSLNITVRTAPCIQALSNRNAKV